MSERADRVALAATAFAVVVSWSYVGQHLGAKWLDDGRGASVIMQAHVPFYWRCFVALWHGLLVAAVLGLGVSEAGAGRWLERLRPWLVPTMLTAAILAAAVP